MRVFPPEALPPEVYSVVFIPGLIVLHLEKVPSHHWFFLHVLFTQLLVMYIPFSKLVHVVSGVVTSALYGSRRREYGV
jgi:nitrate reductase gamma subunit